jgi:hypothetical protein
MEILMTKTELSDSTRMKIDALLQRQSLITSGKHAAFQFSWKAHGDIEQIRLEIQTVEEEIANPPKALRLAMTSTASPRIYKDAYLAGLKEALSLILEVSQLNTSDEVPK